MQQYREECRRKKNLDNRIRSLMSDAAKALQVTNTDTDGTNNQKHKSNLCLICDCFVMGAYPKGVPTMKATLCPGNTVSTPLDGEFLKI